MRPETMLDYVACRIGKPRCHRQIRNGINFAMCNYCGRQSEVHEFGGPAPRVVAESPPVDVPEEEPEEQDRWHYIQIDCEWQNFKFICEAPVGSACRMLPACQLPGGWCADYEGDHAIVCTEKDRVLLDTGECVIQQWIENGEECGRGEFIIPVTTDWTGDWWVWRPNVRTI